MDEDAVVTLLFVLDVADLMEAGHDLIAVVRNEQGGHVQ